jgi:hypothetical protein
MKTIIDFLAFAFLVGGALFSYGFALASVTMNRETKAYRISLIFVVSWATAVLIFALTSD